MTDIASYLTVAAILMLLGACSSKISARLNIPVLILFLAVGMLAGSDFLGFIDFENAKIANVIGSVAMGYILFFNGFDTHWTSVKKIFVVGSVLASVGTLLTAIFGGTLIYLLFHLIFEYYPNAFGFTEQPSLLWCILLGAIVSSTDDAAVFAVLRGRSVSLPNKLRSLLEYESGSNDPAAAFFTVFIIGLITTPGGSYWGIIPAFLFEMSVGVAFGLSLAKLAIWLFNRINFEYDGLYYVASLGMVLLAFGGSVLCHGNGFVAAYAAGIVMGNSKYIFQHGIGRFHGGISWLMQVTLFVMLGLLSFPKQELPKLWIPGLAVTVFMVFFARPLAVFLCTFGSKFTFKEKLFISWVGLRGAAPIMLATFPLMADLPDSWKMFHLVFFVVVLSVVVQGRTIMPLARLLKLDEPAKPPVSHAPLLFENTGAMNGEMQEFLIPPGAACIGKRLAELGLPQGALVLLIRRKRRFVVPNGNTVIEVNDGLMILGQPDILDSAAPILSGAATPQLPA